MSFLNRSSAPLTAFNLQKVSTIAILLLVGWGFSLTLYTLQLQHSCQPLLDWGNMVDRQCPPAIATLPQRRQEPDELPNPIKLNPEKTLKTLTVNPAPPNERSPMFTTPDQIEIEPAIGGIDPKEIVAIGIGVVTVIGLSLIGAPVAIVAATGAVVWFTARTLTQTLM